MHFNEPDFNVRHERDEGAERTSGFAKGPDRSIERDGFAAHVEPELARDGVIETDVIPAGPDHKADGTLGRRDFVDGELMLGEESRS